MKNCAYISRRELIAGAASGVSLSTQVSSALAQANPTLSYGDQILLRALFNAPWVPSIASEKKLPPIYCLWDPTCDHCAALLKDVSENKYPNYEFRWIGAAAKNKEQEKLIAYISKLPTFVGLNDSIRAAAKASNLTDAYVARTNSAELIQYSIFSIKSTKGFYPILAGYDGRQIVTASGNGPGKGISQFKQLSSPAISEKRSLSYLSEEWVDLGPAEGALPASSTTYIVFALPTWQSAPLINVEAGQTIKTSAKRRYRVGKEEWLQTDVLFSVAGRKYPGYIRVG